ncbi:4-(cytidine 5'-diphospho)-2-C-methyl-D-erythritol kinase [Camelimonas abortus]|uniref:4-diphosphocytidyl-2-C-methyl-D-erythritol kinase n=1 Tax=Camelimonas abortus TaxID=1017184 RepID=A0ABV7LIM1_9HYPH
MSALATEAPAKINLTLRVSGRRADGFHELLSLVAFAAEADALTLEPGDSLALTVTGDTAAQAGPDADNLVLRAARALLALAPGLRAGRFHLVKRLPAAAGIGGGSSDAAAALRLLARLNGLAADDPRLLQAARTTGADVPVCLDPRGRVMAGAGEALGPPLGFPALPAVLVNPGVAVATPAVFRALAAGPLDPEAARAARRLTPDVSSAAALRRHVLAGGNDLEAPAMGLCPQIGDALALLRADSGCWLARMSGSGATCFGLFDSAAAATAAAVRLQAARPGWWVRATTLA